MLPLVSLKTCAIDRNDMILLNLASDEYSAVVDVENLPEAVKSICQGGLLGRR